MSKHPTWMCPPPAVCREAMLNRDPAFDGRFFVGVKTTGVYCRNVCKVRIPRPENVTYHISAAAAERAGFRPCLRCRPETAPFSPAWNGTKTTVQRAVRLIYAGALNEGSVTDLADRLGVGPRHLNRLLNEQIGAGATELATTFRIQKAKRLIDETNLSMRTIAFEAGFPSVRRFNAAIAALYGRPPTALRKSGSRDTQT